MTKNDNKQKILTEEDIKIIQSNPASLADYVVYTKVKEARKTAIIVSLVAMAIAFAGGFVCSMMVTKNSIPNNVVQIKVGDSVSSETVPAETSETAELEK